MIGFLPHWNTVFSNYISIHFFTIRDIFKNANLKIITIMIGFDLQIQAPLYSAKLRISELLKDDEGQTYILTVENEVGPANLTITPNDFEKGLFFLNVFIYLINDGNIRTIYEL